MSDALQADTPVLNGPLSAASRLFSRAALIFSAAGLLGMTAIIGWQVFARYVLDAAPAWTEQAALYLMLWFILFAAAAGVREGFHIRLSLLQDLATARVAKAMRTVSGVIVCAFGAAMAWSGVELAIATWGHVIPALGLPRGSAYLPIAGAGALITLFSAEHILADWRGKRVDALWS